MNLTWNYVKISGIFLLILLFMNSACSSLVIGRVNSHISSNEGLPKQNIKTKQTISSANRRRLANGVKYAALTMSGRPPHVKYNEGWPYPATPS